MAGEEEEEVEVEEEEQVMLFCAYCPLSAECARGRAKFPTKLSEDEARWPVSQHLNSDAHPNLDTADAEELASTCEVASWKGPKSEAIKRHWSAPSRRPAERRSRSRRRRGGHRDGGASSSRSMVPADRRPIQLDVRGDGGLSFTRRLVSAVDAARMQLAVMCGKIIVSSSSTVNGVSGVVWNLTSCAHGHMQKERYQLRFSHGAFHSMLSSQAMARAEKGLRGAARIAKAAAMSWEEEWGFNFIAVCKDMFAKVPIRFSV